MEILKTVLLILFAIDCIALTVIVLMQEGKSAGLGTIAGMAGLQHHACGEEEKRRCRRAVVVHAAASGDYRGVMGFTCSSPEPESFCITND